MGVLVMTQEEKTLLLKDLCARLPYGIVVKTTRGNSNLWSVEVCMNKQYICLTDVGSELMENVKPYLRPLLSMTEKEKEEQSKIVIQSMSCSLDNSESATTMLNDWLLSKHFDVRGLISKGLALEALEGMYKHYYKF